MEVSVAISPTAAQDGQGWECGDIVGGVEGTSAAAATHLGQVHLQDHESLHSESWSVCGLGSPLPGHRLSTLERSWTAGSLRS